MPKIPPDPASYRREPAEEVLGYLNNVIVT
jgi:hypothetical protein